jgi:thioredoxin 1
MNDKTTYTNLTDENFQREVLECPGTVLVVFGADWSGACRIIDPVLERLEAEYRGRIGFGKLDIDSNKRTAKEYAISKLPTLIFFKNGHVIDHIAGVASEKDIASRLVTLL